MRGQTPLYQWTFDNATGSGTGLTVPPAIVDSGDGYTGGNLSVMINGGSGTLSTPTGSGVGGLANGSDRGLVNSGLFNYASGALAGGVGNLSQFTNFTVTLWFKLNAGVTNFSSLNGYGYGFFGRLFCIDTNVTGTSADGNELYFALGPPAAAGQPLRVQFGVFIPANAPFAEPFDTIGGASPATFTNQWVFIAASYTPDANGTVNFYTGTTNVAAALTATLTGVGTLAATNHWLSTSNLVEIGNRIASSGNRCVMGNMDDVRFYGSALTLAQVQAIQSVYLPLAISQQPMAQNPFAGGMANFSVAATGYAVNPSFQWRKDGTNLTDDGRILGSQTPSLTVSNVSAADVGGYDAVVTSSSLSVTSRVALLTLNTNTYSGSVLYLSGTDKDHTVPWQFTISAGAQAGIATNIPVPSCWENMGFGYYQYGGTANTEFGQYSCTFAVPPAWAGQRVFLVFEGVFTDTAVAINGIPITPTHQGGFCEFQYDVTTNVVIGASTNILQVKVNKWSANASINNAERAADYWTFGGIYRPVYLQAKPPAFIDRLAANPKANGQISVQVYLGGVSSNCNVSALVTDSNNVPLGGSFSVSVPAGASNVTLSASLPTPHPWSAEQPTLYSLAVQLRDGNNAVLDTVTNLIGFRTITFSNNLGFFVNGKKVVMRGVSRHEAWPTTGRATSRDLAALDVSLIKGMNCNAVRLTSYPPNKVFLEECDRQGLYAYDELPGWQHAYDNATAVRMVKELVVRDVNHPCIIGWDNGNEGGWNTNVDNNAGSATNVFAIWDPQNRKTLRPQSTFENVVDNHYPTYSTYAGNLGAGKTAYQCTEILHGLYDGGSGASLQEYWDAMRTAANGMGMFLWVFSDEGIVRTDLGGILDVHGQNAPDGVVGPYREKEASYYTCKAIFNPVQIGAPNPANFTGTLVVTNRFDFTDLTNCAFDWQLGWLPNPTDPTALSTNALTGGFLVALDSGSFTGASVPAQSTGSLALPAFPSGWTNYDALRLTATDPYGNNLYTWTWPLRTPAQIRDRILGQAAASASAITAGVSSAEIIVTNGPLVIHFSRTNGVINSLTVSHQAVSFNNGPSPVANSWAVTSVTNYTDGTNYYVAVNSLASITNAFLWTLRPDGWLKLSYQYWLAGSQDYMGITFNYPSNNVTAMNWLGQGPFRVYKNRLAGQEIFGHTKQFNYGWTGQNTNVSGCLNQWTYPEFAGYHGQLYWATLQTTEQPITVVTPTTNLFFRVLTPPATDKSQVNPVYPPGTISFLHGISPMGEKFNFPTNQGPAGQSYNATGLYSGEVSFYFGPLPSRPAVPLGLAANPGNGRVLLNWDAVAGATGYNLMSSTNSGGSYSRIAFGLSGTAFTNSALSNGTTYYYVVSALNANGESQTSAEVSAKPAAPGRPVFSSILLQGTNLMVTGSNGGAGMSYLLLTSTNLTQPLASWTALTNSFDASGGFSFSNQLNSSTPQQFFLIKLP